MPKYKLIRKQQITGQTFKDILDQCITLDHIEQMNDRKYDGIHLSEVGCNREYMFKVLYPHPVLPPESIRVLNTGTMFHDYIQNTLKHNKVVARSAVEVPVPGEMMISSIDIFPMLIDNKIYLVDLKTISCGKTWSKFYGIKEPIPHHKQQVTQYAYYMNQKLKDEPIILNGIKCHKIENLMIVYIKKCGGDWTKDEIPYSDSMIDFQKKHNDLAFAVNHRYSDIKEFTFRYDPLEALLYAKKVEELKELIKTKTLPPIPEDRDEFACNYFCEYKGLCEEMVN